MGRAITVAASTDGTVRRHDASVSARRWIALGCVAAGLWLLVVGIVYTSLFAVAVAFVTLLFGVYELRTTR